MNIETTLRKHGTRTFWMPVAGTKTNGSRRWIEVFWLWWNLSVLIDRKQQAGFVPTNTEDNGKD